MCRSHTNCMRLTVQMNKSYNESLFVYRCNGQVATSSQLRTTPRLPLPSAVSPCMRGKGRQMRNTSGA